MKNIAIIGASTNARVIFKFIKHYNLFKVICFAVDKEYKTSDKYCGLPLIAIDRLEEYIDIKNDLVFVAVQWNNLNKDRRMLYEKLKGRGYKFANILSPTAIIHEDVEIGDNIWVADNVIIETNCKIGFNTFIKASAFIGESANISNHCFVGAKSIIGGSCHIGEQTFIGLGATVFDEVEVGEKCIIGARVVIKRNIPSFTLVKIITESQKIKQYDCKTIEEKLIARKNIR